ncbi:TetR/AcrR family transcriptional regulator [Thalassoroseus pseudoceratinae]|uniref:TetR/AcrR family transcriptional regulator n=1 Tax=Thalassoroseus pseudoceratinae TaxID=2713176 RepID=UPI001422A727|nr:TetR/AcrR family transcriptional regulator [Thalassoroseus pseudoceratinae]
MSKTRRKKSDARQRILETAERLFYAEGVRAVGIDRIVAEASVAKMSLYNHFASKDELILAVLQYREEQVDQMFVNSMTRHVDQGMNKLEAFFAALKEWFEAENFRGCSFINAAVELADAEHPASQFSVEHKRRFYAMVKAIISEVAGTKAAERTSEAIALLVEGAIIKAVMDQSSHPADVAKETAMALVARAKRK